jgi:hypothetical protein
LPNHHTTTRNIDDKAFFAGCRPPLGRLLTCLISAGPGATSLADFVQWLLAPSAETLHTLDLPFMKDYEVARACKVAPRLRTLGVCQPSVARLHYCRPASLERLYLYGLDGMSTDEADVWVEANRRELGLPNLVVDFVGHHREDRFTLDQCVGAC